MLKFLLYNPIASGVVASAIAAAMWQIVGRLSGLFRTPSDLLATFAGGGVIRKFANHNAARRWLKVEVQRSREIKFLAVRGFPMTHETYALNEILTQNYNPGRHQAVRVLVIDPNGQEAANRA